MEELYVNLIKDMIAKMNALEKTILQTEMSHKYRENLAYWRSELNSRVGGAYLKDLFNDAPDSSPPE